MYDITLRKLIEDIIKLFHLANTPKEKYYVKYFEVISIIKEYLNVSKV